MTDDSVGRLSTLASGLRRNGLVPTVLSPRYAASWPQGLSYYENEVIRPVAAPRSDWSMPLYQRALSKWLHDNLAKFHLVYVDSMREEAAVVTAIASSSGIPTVCRCASVGRGSDLGWASSSRSARKVFSTAAKCGTIITNDAEKTRTLISLGIPERKLLRCEDGILPPIRRDANLTQKARECLGLINPDLNAAENERILLVCASFSPQSKLFPILESLDTFLQNHPDFRVWIVGDGPERNALHSWLCDRGLRNCVAMPGCFGHDEELYQAADIFLVSEPELNIEHRLPMAISAGLPVIIVDSTPTRNFFMGSTVEPLYYPESEPVMIVEHLARIHSDWDNAFKHSSQLRQTMLVLKPRKSSIEAHTRLFQSLIQSRGDS